MCLSVYGVNGMAKGKDKSLSSGTSQDKQRVNEIRQRLNALAIYFPHLEKGIETGWGPVRQHSKNNRYDVAVRLATELLTRIRRSINERLCREVEWAIKHHLRHHPDSEPIMVHAVEELRRRSKPSDCVMVAAVLLDTVPDFNPTIAPLIQEMTGAQSPPPPAT